MKGHSSAVSVEKPLRVSVIFKYMKELTLERNLMYVRNVGKPSAKAQHLPNIKESTLEKKATKELDCEQIFYNFLQFTFLNV